MTDALTEQLQSALGVGSVNFNGHRQAPQVVLVKNSLAPLAANPGTPR